MEKDVKYLVIKDIPSGWESEAKAGDILSVGNFSGFSVLFKDGKAVCDINSLYFDECVVEYRIN